ncbi:hypothetical protein [Brevibacillus sp. MS2.2]|nr:hypothetical protein [Brevibacillus sp. MS2.2]NRR21256.1 hypothetical protein [Brevibacillus sp. MS2.2]
MKALKNPIIWPLPFFEAADMAAHEPKKRPTCQPFGRKRVFILACGITT